MAGKSRSSSFARRPFRRRSGLKTPTEPKRWELGNFLVTVEAEVPNTSDNLTSLTIHLAQVDSLYRAAFGSTEALRGQQIRALELGGIVLHRMIYESTDPLFGEAGGDNPGAENIVHCFEHLFTDRLNVGGGAAGAGYRWNLNQTPFSNAPLAAATPDSEPMRIHWSNYFVGNQHVNRIEDLPENTGVVLNNSALNHQGHKTLNKRLRLRLDNFHGLCYQVSWYTGAAYAAFRSKFFIVSCQGSIYYRVRS